MSEPSKQVPVEVVEPAAAGRMTQAILDFVSRIPGSRVDPSSDPEAAARQLAQRAAQRAALASGSLALPPGPLGWLTLLPELAAIWRIQAQMVSDIAASYGKHAELGREQMMWCLFRHTAAQAFRDLVVQMGDRLLFRRMSWRVAERVAKQVGVKIGQRTLSKGFSRWLPLVGALGVGAYAYYDTGQVAATAIELFGGGIEIEPDADAEPGAAATPKATAKAATAKRPIARKTAAAVGKGLEQAGKAVRKAAGAARKAARKPPTKP